jgi:hypothetical protein
LQDHDILLILLCGVEKEEWWKVEEQRERFNPYAEAVLITLLRHTIANIPSVLCPTAWLV